MNKKRRRLTLAALAVFGLIIFFHYCDPWFHQGQLSFGEGGAWHGGRYYAGSIEPLIADGRMPLFALAVVYAGLFFLFGGKDAAPVPRRPINWRRILVVISVLLMGGGTVGLINYSNEQNRQREKRRQSAIATATQIRDFEESKHRIAQSEIDLIDLRLGRPPFGGPLFDLRGRIRNRSASTLYSITLKVTMREKGSPDILGQVTAEVTVDVPAHQTREISKQILFFNLPEIKEPQWEYYVTEIRGSKSANWFEANAPSASKFLGITATPSPTP